MHHKEKRRSTCSTREDLVTHLRIRMAQIFALLIDQNFKFRCWLFDLVIRFTRVYIYISRLVDFSLFAIKLTLSLPGVHISSHHASPQFHNQVTNTAPSHEYHCSHTVIGFKTSVVVDIICLDRSSSSSSFAYTRSAIHLIWENRGVLLAWYLAILKFWLTFPLFIQRKATRESLSPWGSMTCELVWFPLFDRPATAAEWYHNDDAKQSQEKPKPMMSVQTISLYEAIQFTSMYCVN